MWPFTRKPPAAAAPVVPVLTTRKIKPVGKHETFADRLDWACQQYKATYEIQRTASEVIVRLVMDDGHYIVSGRGRTTGEAVTAVLKKMEAK